MPEIFKNKEIAIFTMLGLVSAFLIFINNGNQYNALVLFLFFAISAIALGGIFLSIDKNPFSLNKTFYLFYYFFFGIAPAIQYKFQSSFFNAPLISAKLYIKGGLLLLGILLLYNFLYHVTYKILDKRNYKLNSVIRNETPIYFYYGVAILSFVVFFVLIKFNVKYLVLRPPSFWLKNNTYLGVLGYGISLVVRAIPVVVVLQYILKNKYDKKHLFLLGIIAIITAFPTALSRGEAVSLYLPFLVLLLPVFKRQNVYALSYFFGFFLIFPILNFFRSQANNVYVGIEVFKTGHFDAFQNFVLLINEEIITFGKQLIGSMLFFIQEGQWLQKPIGTGTMLAEKLNFEHTNISMPFFGEGYANYGYTGIIVFIILIVLLNATFDLKYHKNSGSLFFKLVYLFLLGFEFYILRGDLMSSVKKLCVFIISVSCVLFYFKIAGSINKVFLKKRSTK
ncbi:hypothetical protein [Lutibacter sp.]|uniref:hypothetical protein n=1 Tax=Lutibacter sp. TaxID=1925666 RepID=UPI0035630AC1